MKSRLLFFIISTLLSANYIYAQEDSTATLSYERLILESHINYLQYSIINLKNSENKAISDAIYYSIINELDISTISNSKILRTYTDFLNNCSELKLNQNEKDFLVNINEQQQKKAYLSAFSNMGSIFVPGRSPQQMVASLVYTTISNIVAIENTKNQLQNQLQRDLFYLDQNALETMYLMQTNLFTTSISTLSGLSGKDGRITEDTMRAFIRSLNLSSNDAKLAALSESNLSKSMATFPPYWYELGNAFQIAGDYESALESYTKFEDLKKRDIIRRDQIYKKVLINKISLLLGNNPLKISENAFKNKSQILDCVEILKNQYLDSDAGEKNIYLSKIYFLIGEYQNSIDCLNHVIHTGELYPEYIEGATQLKRLINSASTEALGDLYQVIYNFSKIAFGNNCALVENFNHERKSFVRKWYETGIDNVKSIFSRDQSVIRGNNIFDELFQRSTFGVISRYVNQDDNNLIENCLNYNNLYFELPKDIILNNKIVVNFNGKNYTPLCIVEKSNLSDISICYVDVSTEELSKHTKVTLMLTDKTTGATYRLNYKFEEIDEEIVSSAIKATSRIGTDINTINAELAYLYGQIINNYRYEVKDAEQEVADIRQEVNKVGSKKNWSKTEIEAEISSRVLKSLQPDIDYLNNRLNAARKDFYGQESVLINPTLAKFYDTYYLIGIETVVDVKSGTAYKMTSKSDFIKLK